MCQRDAAHDLNLANDPSGCPNRRTVPPFSLQSLQKNTMVVSQSCFNQSRKRSPQKKASKETQFRMYYQRGDLPIKVEYLSGGVRIIWTVDLDKIDIGFYLPLFFDGLAETDHPYKVYARQGVEDLINFGREKIYTIIPQLILPIKSECQCKVVNTRKCLIESGTTTL